VRARNLRNLGIVCGLAALALACAESSWEAARRLDTVAGYNQFLRDHPNSPRQTEAKERMDYLRVTTYRTIEVFEEFERRYPNSPLLANLREQVESLYFAKAREANTPSGYAAFLRAYPSGEYAARAQGNSFYVSQVRTNPTPRALRDFIERHPESDFVEESKRTLEVMAARQETAIKRLGVRVEVAPNVAQAARVRQGFASMVAREYRARGIDLKLLEAGEEAGPDLDAWMIIEYREAPASGVLGGNTLLSHCRVRLFPTGSNEPVWDREFEAPADHLLKGAYGRDKTLFANAKFRFWDNFFVPVSSWSVTRTRVKTLDYFEDVRAIDVRGDRAALLLERGGIDFLDVSSPGSVEVVDRYRREADLTDWSGVRLLSEDLALSFGSDGAELIRRTELAAERLARFEAPDVGAIRGGVLYDRDTLLFAGNRGAFAVRMQRSPLEAQRLLDGEVVGIEAVPPYVFVVRPQRVEVTSPRQLLQHITVRGTAFPRGFKAKRAKLVGDSLYVFGENELLEVNIRDAQNPRVAERMSHENFGPIADLGGEYGNLYMLGARGLQITGQGGRPVNDNIQVTANQAIGIKDRFALLVGNHKLEVLDLAPYQGLPAASEK
jgi:hypothetical protein